MVSYLRRPDATVVPYGVEYVVVCSCVCCMQVVSYLRRPDATVVLYCVEYVVVYVVCAVSARYLSTGGIVLARCVVTVSCMFGISNL